MGRTGLSGPDPERVRGWGRWGRETREAESGVRLFAAAAPGGSGPLPALPFLRRTAGSWRPFPARSLSVSLDKVRWVYTPPSGHFQPAHSPERPPDSPVLSCCNTPTPWTSSPCALPRPRVQRLGGAPPGCLWPGRVGSGLRSLVCQCGPPSHGLDGVALRGLGGRATWWAEDHSELPHQKGTGWGSWWPRPSRPAILYPGPGSGRSSQWDATNTVRAIMRGAGRLQVTSGQGPEGLKPGFGPVSHPAHGCLLFSEARILRLQGLPDQCVTPRRVSSP